MKLYKVKTKRNRNHQLKSQKMLRSCPHWLQQNPDAREFLKFSSVCKLTLSACQRRKSEKSHSVFGHSFSCPRSIFMIADRSARLLWYSLSAVINCFASLFFCASCSPFRSLSRFRSHRQAETLSIGRRKEHGAVRCARMPAPNT